MQEILNSIFAPIFWLSLGSLIGVIFILQLTVYSYSRSHPAHGAKKIWVYALAYLLMALNFVFVFGAAYFLGASSRDNVDWFVVYLVSAAVVTSKAGIYLMNRHLKLEKFVQRIFCL